MLESQEARSARFLLGGDTDPQVGRDGIVLEADVEFSQGATNSKGQRSLCHCDVLFESVARLEGQ